MCLQFLVSPLAGTGLSSLNWLLRHPTELRCLSPARTPPRWSPVGRYGLQTSLGHSRASRASSQGSWLAARKGRQPRNNTIIGLPQKPTSNLGPGDEIRQLCSVCDEIGELCSVQTAGFQLLQTLALSGQGLKQQGEQACCRLSTVAIWQSSRTYCSLSNRTILFIWLLHCIVLSI